MGLEREEQEKKGPKEDSDNVVLGNWKMTEVCDAFDGAFHLDFISFP